MIDMDSETHAIFGGAAAGFFYLVDSLRNNKKIQINELIGSIFIGAGSSLVPDLIEPATNPNHRGIFHSIAISSLPVGYLKYSTDNPDVTDKTRWIKNAVSVGYLTHLALDGMTPKRLPLLV